MSQTGWYHKLHHLRCRRRRQPRRRDPPPSLSPGAPSATLLNFLFACIFVYKLLPAVVYARTKSVFSPATCADNDADACSPSPPRRPAAGTDALGSKLESVRPRNDTTPPSPPGAPQKVCRDCYVGRSRDEKGIMVTLRTSDLISLVRNESVKKAPQIGRESATDGK